MTELERRDLAQETADLVRANDSKVLDRLGVSIAYHMKELGVGEMPKWLWISYLIVGALGAAIAFLMEHLVS